MHDKQCVGGAKSSEKQSKLAQSHVLIYACLAELLALSTVKAYRLFYSSESKAEITQSCSIFSARDDLLQHMLENICATETAKHIYTLHLLENTCAVHKYTPR